jgi:hypothetical protein
MKKIIISLLLISLSMSSILFAEDAFTLPAGVMRLTLANSYITIDEQFDENGESEEFYDVALYNLGAALELGITDTISAALQWAPGTYLYTSVEDDDLNTLLNAVGSSTDNITYAGYADLFAGAKAQIVGENGFIKNDKIRAAMALGVQVPLQDYSLEDEVDSLLAGDDFAYIDQSTTGFLGFGGRFYFDYQFTERFFINLYNQTAYYLPRDNYIYSVTEAATWQAYADAAGDAYAQSTTGIDDPYATEEHIYPIYYDFEIDFNYDLPLSEKSKMGFGFPLQYSFNGETSVDGEGQDDASYSVGISPSISFFTAESIPFEVAFNYYLTLAGENTYKKNYAGLQLKLFYDFY